MELTFRNFPYDFRKSDNFFRSLILESQIENLGIPEINFFGCYPEKTLGSKLLLYTKSKISNSGMTEWLNFQNGKPTHVKTSSLNFWATYENRRPPLESSLFTFSFDLDSYNGTNFYLPLIYLYMDLNLQHPYTPKHFVSQHSAASHRDIPPELKNKRRKDACTFINNPQPMRLRALHEFGKKHNVEIYGRYAGNYSKDKIKTSEDYWLNFCFENDLYPGYVTEKALEAWLSYSIPVYWGDDAAGILNPSALVNLKNFDSMDEFIKYLNYLLNNKKLMLEMISQPILNKKLNIPDVRNFVFKAARSLKT